MRPRLRTSAFDKSVTPSSPPITDPGSTLLVASGGGHIAELHMLRDRMSLGPNVEWATFDTAQTRSLLVGETVHRVPLIAPRDVRNITRTLPFAWRILRTGHYDRVISTGSAVALPFLVLARTLGCDCHYIESAARRERPSLTGRLLRALPGIRLYSQASRWADETWSYRGSVFDGFEPAAEGQASVRRVVVTLGTLDFCFRRLVERLVDVIPRDADVLWQTGKTNVDGLPIDVQEQLSAPALAEAIRTADVVIAHAGVGSALSVLEAGRCPVLIPRREAAAEHVDDHQHSIAAELADRGLAITCDAAAVTLGDMQRASRIRIRRTSGVFAFGLTG